MSEHITAKEISNITGKTVRTIQKTANKDNWEYTTEPGIGGKIRKYPVSSLPDDIQIKYNQVSHMTPIIKGTSTSISTNTTPPGAPALCQDQINKALAKADLLRLYRQNLKRAPWGKKGIARTQFMTAYNSGIAYQNLYEILGKVSWKTIEGWKQSVKSGDTLNLADRRGYYKRGRCELSDEQTDILLRCALHPNKPLISEAIRMACSIMNTRGIENGYSDATYRRWLEKWVSINHHIWTFSRKGAKAWNDECAYYIERDYSLINVGDILVADGHVLNFEILNPWTGKPKRMALIVWLDMKSSFPLGWEIMPTENTQAIASAFRRAILRLGKVPQVAYMDNGKAFSSRFFNGADLEQAGFSGLFERLGIKTIHAWPYHGQSKTVERFFGTFAELERWCPTYSGTSIEKKPPRMMRGERLHRKVYDKAMRGRHLTLEQAHRVIAAWFNEYVQRSQRGHLEGRAPVDLFLEEKGPGIDKAKLQYLMMSLEIRHINRNGIYFLGKNYYDPALYGRRHPVTIRYDLQDNTSILVFERDGAFICEARQVDKVHPAASILGTKADVEKLTKQIEHKRSQEKQAGVSARAFLEQEVIPEHRKQLERLGITYDSKNCLKKLPEKTELTPEDEARIQEEVKDLRKHQDELPKEPEQEEYIPEIIDETAEFFKSLFQLSEMDRYENLIEADVRGWLISKKWQAFMTYYEKTEEYARHEDYWEEYRVKMVLTYQTDEVHGLRLPVHG